MKGPVAVLCLAACLAGVVAARAGPGGEEPAEDRRDGTIEGSDYRIGPEDLLRIAVWKNEALSQDVPVRPDGMISLPLLNDVSAAGLTPMELRGVLIERLREYMPSPEVSVIVTEVRSPKVSAVGEVRHPGRFDLRGRMTVLDLLALAGGLTEYADRSRIIVLRRSGSKVTRLSFDYERAARDGVQENFDLRPGDIVLVR